jgi:CheY-like chemotaxis protein
MENLATINPEPTRRFLLVEDEAMIAMMMEDMLLDMGCEVTAIAPDLESALQHAENDAFDAAILDVNLSGVRSYPIADVLRRRSIPYIFTTGYGRAGLDDAYADAPILQKPFQCADLEQAITQVLPET